MKVLVTGGAGYIGSHAIIELIRAGYEPVVLDDFSNSDTAVFENIALSTGKTALLEHYKIDLANHPDYLDYIISQHSDAIGIIHFAAKRYVNESVQKPLLYYQDNINSLANVLKSADKHCIERVIFSSSCSVYGDNAEAPVTEYTPTGIVRSPYAYTKQIGEQMLKDYAFVNCISTIALRYFNPIGADYTGFNGENPINPPTTIVPSLIRAAKSDAKEFTIFGNDYATKDGTCIRDYIHVTDVAQAHIKALEYLCNKFVSYDVFNIGAGKGYSVQEIVDTFQEASGIKLNLLYADRRAGDVEEIYSAPHKAFSELKWKAKYDIGTMMESVCKWAKLK